MNICLTTTLALASAVLSVQAADNMKAFPPAEAGMVRHVLQLPQQKNEAGFKVQLIVGKTVEVLLEGPSKRNSKRWAGRSDTNKVCIVEPQPGLQPGHLAQVRITRATAHSLFGELCVSSVGPRAARVCARSQAEGS